GGLTLRLLGRILPEARRIARLARAVDCHLIHLNNIVSLNRAGILAARWTGRPCLCHIRGLNPLEPVDRWLVRWVDYFVFISEAVRRSQEASGVPMRGEVVYNAVDLEAFRPPRSREALCEEFGLPAEARVFGMVGRLEPWKGHEVFLRALARLRERHPEACGLIVGGMEPNSPQYPDELRGLAEGLGLGGAVAFAGYRPDALQLMTGMDAVVHCSVQPEPFGRVLIEGMAAGKPVIGSAAGAVPEIIEDGVNGLLTPPGDVDALARAMARILEEPVAARAWAEAGRQTVLARFTLARHVGAMQRIYAQMLGNPDREG
ncbi:MAG: glycosyltransferase family 4 protein, partial [Anaerolineae bacterium]|nr:glycosyltransferase family 4 protein [Anaerolineae bacterium]